MRKRHLEEKLVTLHTTSNGKRKKEELWESKHVEMYERMGVIL
jgi:hypothetical protein